ncbi:MAG: 50S ribosomal protein L23 [Candidatus Vogelbacteria bacterium]|nr:50S ribosomal protein L23 [Candidatus Vogelbacteria bacterium]
MSKYFRDINSSSVILTKPRITEKASFLAGNDEHGVYTFEVSKRANKLMVANAIKEIFKVNPTKVNIINTKAKTVFNRGKRGVVGGVKKAMVYLKKGDKIDII